MNLKDLTGFIKAVPFRIRQNRFSILKRHDNSGSGIRLTACQPEKNGMRIVKKTTTELRDYLKFVGVAQN